MFLFLGAGKAGTGYILCWLQSVSHGRSVMQVVCLLCNFWLAAGHIKGKLGSVWCAEYRSSYVGLMRATGASLEQQTFLFPRGRGGRHR
jgi:hypothetical protein